MVVHRLRLAMAATALALGLSGGAGAVEFYRMSTLGPGSSPYLVMSTFATIVNEALPDAEIQVNATGAATMHAVEAARGEIDFFMAAPSVHELMVDGRAMYERLPDAPELAQELRLVLSFPIGLYHVVVYGESGVEDLEDVAGRRVFLGPPGGGALRTAQMLFEAATELKPNEDFEVVQLGWAAAAQAFQDRQIDVYVNPTNAPSPVISQIALTNEIRLLGLSDDDLADPEVQSLINRTGGTMGEIPPGIYGDNQLNTEPVTTIGSIVGIGTNKDLPEDVVYAMTKAFWEGVAERREGAPWLRQVKLENALLKANMPLHPGALRYYREVGLNVPDELVPPEAG